MEYEGTQENGSEAELGHVAPERQAAAVAAVNGGIPLLADANNVVLLPEGATLDDISVRGRDLVITLDDGRVYVIADGAVFVPQIVIDGVSVPPMNLAALLTSNEPQPAAGPVSSSGGNFAEAVNPIQDAFELGNLLPYTELAFPEPREEEIFPWLYDRDEEPTIAIITGDNPAGVQSAVSTVHEAGLAARGNKPAGTDAQSDSETTTGTITFNAPDGLASIALNGVVITNVGQTITTAQGVLTITSISGGSIGYSYTLTDNILGPPADEVFIATVTDADGDTATATLTITIKDDAPIARPDFDSVSEDGPLVADGNVLTGSGGSDANGTDGVADTQGADGAVVSTTGTFVGQYGTLVLNADGSYVYTLDNTNPYVQALSEGETLNEVFPYTLTDGDGDTSSTTLTITINGADDGVTINGLDVTGGAVIVNEEHLAWGSAPDAGALTQTGSFTVTSPDGLADVTVGGVVVVSGGVFTPQTITTPQGILTITGFTPTVAGGVITGGTFTYSYELTSDTPGHGAPGEDTVSDSFPVVVTDRDGSSANASLDVTVIDDVPTARDDAAISVAEDFAGTVGGNVLSNDTQGADGATLTSVTIAGTTTAIAPVGSTTITTPHGVYVFDASGDWTFDPANGLDNTAGIDASFSYVITDGDGDQSTAIQPITITDGDKPTAGAPISLVLDDQNLPNGSTPAGSDSATATIVFAPGSDAIVSIVFGTDLSGLGGGLTWTRISDTQITGTDGGRPVVTLDLVRVGDGAQVTATLDGNYAGHTGINIDDVADLGSIGVVATDTDGDTATGTVNLSVSDDLPQVSASSDELPALVVDETAFATDASASFAGAFAINYGADGSGGVTYALAVTAGPSGLVDTLSGQPVILSLTAGGVLEGRTADGDLVFTVTVDANGVVTLNQSRAVEHSDTSDHDDATTLSAADLVRLTATATDGDGDTASATINIGDKLLFRDDGPSIEAAVIDGDTVLLTTHDAQTVGDDSDTSVSSANFSGAFSLAHSSHGADGAGTVTWSYALSVTNPVSGLSSNGAAITLSLNAGVVEGRTEAGDLIFTLQTDANGVVTLTQHAEIDHAPNNGTAPYDTQLAVLGNGLVQLSGTATITDGDGDSASDTVHLDLGGNVRFADDGPAISTTDAQIKVTVDESYFPYDASANFAAAFAVNYGADGAGSVTYALAVTAGPSGLVDTLTGQPVILSLTAGGVVEGRTADGDLVFTVTVDANGVVTLDQSRAIVHSDTNDHDDAATLSAADLVRLTATVTDGDGDTASATINIGDKLLFRDDGPSIEAAVIDGDTILLTTHDAQTVRDDSDTSVSSANFSGAFSLAHSSHGADGAGTVTWSYALSVTNPVSGLSSNGAAITLSLNAGVVEGRTASGDLIFTLQTDANGVVTLTQHAEIDHAPNNGTAPYDTQLAVLGNGLVQLSGTATITDRDGDSASDTVHLDLGGNVRFADDGPAITTTDALIKVTVDESYFPYDASANFAAAFAVNYGADGAGSVTYALAVTAGPSGLVDTLSGQPVILSLTAGGVVEGRTAGGDLVFTVTVDANGVVTLDQSRAIVHSDTSDHDDAATLSAADLVRLTATVTDGDGDTASATINIGDKLLFRDDGPSIEAAVIDGDTILLTTHDAQTIGDDSDTSVSSANFSGAFSLAHSSHGADGAGTVTWSYALSVTNPVSGLSSNGAAITLSLNAGVVEGRTASGALIFTLQTDANGVVTLTQHAEIDHAPNNGTAPYDTQLAVLGNGLVQLSGTATITDRDGDSASDTVHLDLGGNVRFADDGPAISTTDAQIKVTVDESYFPYDASANFAAAFAVNYGADGAGSVTYALAVTAGPSGLVDTLSGQPVILSLTAGGVVEGRTADGDLVFTVTVDANGVVTLDQSRAIVHSDPNDHDDAATLSAADLVRLTATATDGDGDAASATINIGDRLVFRDAGPTINIVANGTTLVVDESLGVVGSGQNEGGAANDDEVATGAAPGAIGYASGILHADAGTNAGSDGLASQVYSLAVGSAASGLVDTVSNQNVVLTLTATGVVEGRTAIGNELVFSLAVDADTGEVHFNQFRAIRHNDTSDHDENGASAATLLAGSVSLEVALTDRDGDTARDSIDISTALKFEDDGPVAVADSALMITGMADGLPAAPISGSLTANDDFGTDGGRVQSITIGSATYTWNGTTAISVSDGGTLTGTVLSAETPLGGTLTFDFASGVWSYKPPPSVDAPTNEVFAYTIVDGDGDTAASALTITVRNDGVPSTVPVTATLDEDGLPGGIAGGADDLDANLGADGVPGGGDDDLDGPDSSEATFSGVLGITYGSDGPGTVSFAQLDGTTVAVGVETATLTWNADSQTLTATGPRGALFTVELTDESTGAYKVTLLDNVLHPAGEAENDATVSLTYGLTDGNGTAGNGVLNIIFDDDKPGIFETSEISLGTGLSSTGVFTYGIGADSRGSYSVADGDFTSVALSGRVGSGAITNVTTTKTGETASSATFAFSFSYDADPSTAGMQEATSSGILSFNKATGQFTFTLDERLASHDETVGGGSKAPEFSLDIDVTITDTDGDAVSSTLNVRGVAAPMADGIAGLLADTAFAADRQSRETGRAVETAAVAAAASALIAATLTVDVPPALAAADPRPAAQGVETAPAATLAEAGDSQAAQDHKASDLLGDTGSAALDAPETNVGADAATDAPTQLTSVVDHAETTPAFDHQQADAEPAISHALLSDGAGTMQAMEALLALQAPPAPEDSAPSEPQAAAEIPVVEEALADARDAAFVDVLIDRLGGSADHAGPAAPQDGADIAKALSAHVDGGATVIQSAFDLAQMAHDASAQAAAQHV